MSIPLSTPEVDELRRLLVAPSGHSARSLFKANAKVRELVKAGKGTVPLSVLRMVLLDLAEAMNANQPLDVSQRDSFMAGLEPRFLELMDDLQHNRSTTATLEGLVGATMSNLP